jgi:hypothetical protein
MAFLAFLIIDVFSTTLAQFLHKQFLSQNLPTVKHSQYIFKHLDLLHLQVKLATVLDFCLSIVSCESRAIVLCLFIVFLPRPLVLLLVSESGD